MIENIVNDLKPFLRQYLEDQEVDLSSGGALRCISPNHEDSTRSMQLATRDGGIYCYCHACGASYDILSAATVLEGKPSGGDSWVEETVLELADRYDIVYDTTELRFHSRDPRVYEARRAYQHVSDLLKESKLSDNAQTYIADRQWSEGTVREFGLGSLAAHSVMQNLTSANFDTELMDQIGLNDIGVFHPDNLIFPIKNKHGKTIGFTARRFSDTNGPKYINSPGISEFSPYRKREALFNIQNIDSQPGPLYIVEGQTDAITLWQAGYNAISINGSTLTPEQTSIIKEQSPSRIVLWSDNDNAGQEALIKKIIPTALKAQLTPVPEVIVGLSDDQDPDDFIRAGGDPKELDTVSAIRFYGQYVDAVSNIGRDVLAERLVTLVSDYQSPITRSLMAREIHKVTNISENAIYARLNEIDRQKQALVDERRTVIIQDLARQLPKDPHKASQLMINGLSDLESLSHKEDKLSSQSFFDYVKDIRTEEEDKDDTFPGMVAPRFTAFQNAFVGDWVGKFFVFAGAENTGKSTISLSYFIDMALCEENNAMLIVHTTDDSTREVLPKAICNINALYGDGTLSYINITNPRFGHVSAKQVQEILQTRASAYDILLQKIKDERIVIKDKRSGGDLDFTRALLRYYRTKHPDRRILLLLDSVNRVRVPFSLGGEQRSKMTFISNTMADLAIEFDATTAAVSEFNRPHNKGEYMKPGHIRWPTNQRLAEARALEYDANAIILLHNDVHDKGNDKACVLWRDTVGNIRPRVVACITKNKISNEKDKYAFNMDEIRARFSFIPYDTWNQEWQTEANRLLEEAEDRYSSEDEDSSTKISSNTIPSKESANGWKQGKFSYRPSEQNPQDSREPLRLPNPVVKRPSVVDTLTVT